ncbi:MAG: XTP/dITP diphosphatase [Deltaproteobacteria bacterium]|nr:XTP/dITP diphosphatase [Deltaproteobacteria bacterium]
MTRKVVIATKNKGKIAEIKSIFNIPSLEFLTLEDFPSIELPPEAGKTFADNALAKARHVALKTGLIALADDSGLEVDALGGRPGVFSARYAGENAADRDNYIKLLSELEGVEDRRARFRCAVALSDPKDGDKTFEGVFEGVISKGPKGVGGFGYDPVFFVPDKNKTVAELTPEEKNSISHRAKALMKLKEWLEKKGK